MPMDDWPRYGKQERKIGDEARLEVYQRNDELGNGMCLSLYVTDKEVMRFDLFEKDAHQHWSVDGKRQFYPYYWDFSHHVELALHNLVDQNPQAIKEDGQDVTLDPQEVTDAANWAREILLRPPTRAVIAAAGDATGWRNYLGIPKHLISFNGENLLERMVRLLRSNGVTDIRIVANHDSYKVEGAELYKPNLNKENLDADKVLSSQPVWNESGRTILLFGDVYFSEEAISRIVRNPDRRFTAFGRPTPSFKTGKKWAESFGCSFYDSDREKVVEGCQRTLELFRTHKTEGCSLWHLYKAMIGLPDEAMQRMVAGEQLLLIDDLTEDFDMPVDYERFKELV